MSGVSKQNNAGKKGSKTSKSSETQDNPERKDGIITELIPEESDIQKETNAVTENETNTVTQSEETVIQQNNITSTNSSISKDVLVNLLNEELKKLGNPDLLSDFLKTTLVEKFSTMGLDSIISETVITTWDYWVRQTLSSNSSIQPVLPVSTTYISNRNEESKSYVDLVVNILKQQKALRSNYNFWMAHAMKLIIEEHVPAKNLHGIVAQKVLKQIWDINSTNDSSVDINAKMAAMNSVFITESEETEDIFLMNELGVIQEFGSQYSWKPSYVDAVSTARILEARLKYFNLPLGLINFNLINTLISDHVFKVENSTGSNIGTVAL